MKIESSELIRKEFESWATANYGVKRIGKVNNTYSNDNVEHDWLVWQASRRADYSSIVETGSAIVEQLITGLENATASNS